MNSSIVKLEELVRFPAWTGERIYMEPFIVGRSLPRSCKRWQPLVDSMCVGMKDHIAYLMVDQGQVEKGTTHRRSGIHVDGAWLGYDHGFRIDKTGDTLLLTSDVLGCAGYEGWWDGIINEGGSCNITSHTLKKVEMLPNFVYKGEAASMLHEAILLLQDTKRTVVRINVERRKK